VTGEAEDRRQADLDAIRRTYTGYEASGHEERWSHANRGEARLSQQARQAILDEVVRALPPGGGRLLDLGCGDGSLAGAAHERGIESEWVGVDLRESAVAQASVSYPWATFRVQSADALAFEDGFFDVVVAAVLFSSLPSAELERAIAAEIARVLKPGGTLVWYDMRYPNPANPAVHHVPASRLRTLFGGWQATLRSLTILPPLARRLGSLTGIAYPLLHGLPPLRSHLVGRLIKPMSRRTPRILLVTGLWPTRDMPSAGSFVRDRVGDDRSIRVVGPRRYDIPMPLRYLRLAWDALTVRGRFEGVEAHILFPTGVIGLLTAWLRRVPLVVYVHGDEVRNAVYRNPLYTWLGRMVARKASAIVVNSAETARHTARLGGPLPVVIAPGIDLDRFRPTPRPAERRVLYLGGDRPEKGIQMARRHADTLAGHFLNEVDPAEVPALIAAHDVVLVPSVEEGFGLVAAEAIASGRWVVANAVGGLPEVINDGVNGTLVRDGDFARGLANVPDYDPEAVAASAGRFSVERHRAGLADVWGSVLWEAPGAAS
jgi:glycosyltransferase involved in cell wall biosynthesis/ubiquinone/menaquinone biosynthesis C-methylase UbiE